MEPYALKVFKRRWYLLGKYGDGPLKVYALDRILDIDIEFEDFTLPADFNAAEFFGQSLDPVRFLQKSRRAVGKQMTGKRMAQSVGVDVLVDSGRRRRGFDHRPDPFAVQGAAVYRKK